jgi:PhnB protein
MMLSINPYLVLNGTGQEAVVFYEKALGATVDSLSTFSSMPESPEFKMPEEIKNRIMHAHLKIGNTSLMISDTFPDQPHTPGSQVELAIHFGDIEAAKEIFEKLQDGGKVVMELQETFWSPAYGNVVDKFGIGWQLNVTPTPTSN